MYLYFEQESETLLLVSKQNNEETIVCSAQIFGSLLRKGTLNSLLYDDIKPEYVRDAFTIMALVKKSIQFIQLQLMIQPRNDYPLLGIPPYYCACSGNNAASRVCVEKGCKAYAVMCADSTCSCHTPHLRHSLKEYQQFIQGISTPRLIPEELERASKLMQGFLDMTASFFKDLVQRHNRLLRKHVEKQFQYSSLRRKLMNRQAPDAIMQMTGDSMGELYLESTQAIYMRMPYSKPIEQLDKDLGKIREKLNESILLMKEELWNFGEVFRRNKILTDADIKKFERPDFVSFFSCKSKSWQSIGKELGGKKSAKILEFFNCEAIGTFAALSPAGDSICSSLRNLQSLTQLMIGNKQLYLVGCGLTNSGIANILKLKQLTTLRLCTNSLTSVDNPALNDWSFKEILKQLHNLELLDLPLPQVKKLDISKLYSKVGRYGVGLKGLNHIIRNLKNLDSLDIGKFVLNAGSNGIGDIGAQLIANNLANLTELAVRIQWFKLANNSVTERGAWNIAEKMPTLACLYIGYNQLQQAFMERLRAKLPRTKIIADH